MVASSVLLPLPHVEQRTTHQRITPAHSADEGDHSLIQYLNDIFHDAIQRRASDIHFEPYEQQYRIRFREDGLLQEVAQLPTHYKQRIVARLKILAQLDIAEHRLPQDGRFHFSVSPTHTVDMRLSTCPTLHGEKIVVRLLDPNAFQLHLSHLGMNNLQQQRFADAIEQPQGLILVTGPTGSGKTVTLYAALAALNESHRNISSIEDPVEIAFSGINQVTVNRKIGLTFPVVLRAFLRQDPDVLMIGEIRDHETAEMCIQAAHTGHLVFATLHSNNAPQALTRMMNLRIPLYNLASSLSLVVAQRLARRLCDSCKQSHTLSALQRSLFATEQLTPATTVFRANDCSQCRQGYRGRIGLYEILVIDDTLRTAILAGGGTTALQNIARQQGMTSVRHAGLQAVNAGVTSLDEIHRVTVS